ncbi:hypothetical protein RZS08_20660, partial [Arthrospira platensis SPKY1]|nr:hypothetical protein [Arthrospira platensis SPKY1]
ALSASDSVVVNRFVTRKRLVRTYALKCGLRQFGERFFNTSAQELARRRTREACARFAGQKLGALARYTQGDTLNTTEPLEQRGRHCDSRSEGFVVDAFFALT